MPLQEQPEREGLLTTQLSEHQSSQAGFQGEGFADLITKRPVPPPGEAPCRHKESRIAALRPGLCLTGPAPDTPSLLPPWHKLCHVAEQRGFSQTVPGACSPPPFAETEGQACLQQAVTIAALSTTAASRVTHIAPTLPPRTVVPLALTPGQKPPEPYSATTDHFSQNHPSPCPCSRRHYHHQTPPGRCPTLSTQLSLITPASPQLSSASLWGPLGLCVGGANG